MSYASRVAAREEAEDAAREVQQARARCPKAEQLEAEGRPLADHPFKLCDLPFCDHLECRYEYAPGKVCGRAREDHR